MSGSLNKMTLIGNLGRDPETRVMANGKSVVALSLATTESWKDDHSGERVERTEWHRIAIFNEALGRLAAKFLTRGSKVYVEGTIRTRKWTDTATGADKFSTEIHLTPFNGTLTFLDTKRDGDNQGTPPRERAMTTGGAGGGMGTGELDDDVPFGPCWQ